MLIYQRVVFMGLIDQETSPASPTLYLEVQEGIPNSNPKYTRNTVAQVLQNLGSEKKMIQNGLVGIALWSSFRHQKWLVAHQWTWTQQTYQVSQLDEAPTNQSTNWPCSLCGHVFFVGYIP
jgi:hypothetical protein